jgi:L-2-hydroxyglutarate oxidase LhgO
LTARPGPAGERAEVEVVVVGGGIVGLAAAAALGRAGRSVVLLEREPGFARGVTSRNSQVVHAGLYYPTGSWKAKLCVRGRELLYERCARHGLPHRALGKLVVAIDDAELRVLEEILARGRANGAPGLEIVDGAAVARLEPSVRARAALLSPRTGIVDAGALALSFAAEAESHGVLLLRDAEVVGIERRGEGYAVRARIGGGAPETLRASALVNAAGLCADRVAGLAGIDVDARGYRIHPCKGDYFQLAPGAGLRFARLVYPVPVGAGLGVHVTLDTGGRVRLGPDADYVESPRYDVDAGKARAFCDAVRRFVPSLREEWLAAEFAGVRPRLAAPGEGFRDFVVAEESAQGLPGFVNLIGIESPGLTAAPAIAERVVELL